MSGPFTTHEVLNQPPPLEDLNLFASDSALRDAVEREGGGEDAAALDAFGHVAGSAAAFERGRLANQHTPGSRRMTARGAGAIPSPSTPPTTP